MAFFEICKIILEDDCVKNEVYIYKTLMLLTISRVCLFSHGMFAM